MNEELNKAMSNSRTLNVNTILLSIVLALSGWTLTRVLALSEQMSALNESKVVINRDIIELRARLSLVEAQIQATNLTIARMNK